MPSADMLPARLIGRSFCLEHHAFQVWWGDSIAGLPVLQPENWAVWQEYFGAAGWKAAPLGVGGSTVEELTVGIAVVVFLLIPLAGARGSNAPPGHSTPYLLPRCRSGGSYQEEKGRVIHRW